MGIISLLVREKSKLELYAKAYERVNLEPAARIATARGGK